jgi:hypothetical protein
VAYSPCGVSSTSQLLYKEFLNSLFRRGVRCLGRAVFAAKCSVIARNPTDDSVYGPAILWTLFGDPALRIRHRITSAVEEPSSKLGARTSPFAVSVSPNPCDASTAIRFSSPLPIPYSLSLYDAFGRLVHSQPVRTSPFVLCTSFLPPGVYVVEVHAGPGTTTHRKLVVR